MKKALLITAVMLLCASTAFAEAKFSVTGNYWAEGKYWFNYNPGPGAKADYSDSSFGFYEQDINLFPTITFDNTSLNFKVAITDTWWGDYNENGSSDEKVTQDVDTGSIDDNMQIERAFLSHKFNDMFKLDVGLMDGTQWGTKFGDDKQPKWRVKGTATTGAGVFGLVLEKNKDRGSLTMGEEGDIDENEDQDAYGLFWIGKVGNVYIKPLLWYVQSDNAFLDKTADLTDLNGTGLDTLLGAFTTTTDLDQLLGDVDATLFNPVLAFNGDLGAVSFESEFNYKMWTAESEDTSDLDEDWETFGIYLNFYKALDAFTPGIVIAYGSYDDTLYKKANSELAAVEADGAAAAAALAGGDVPTALALQASARLHARNAILAGTLADTYQSFDFEDDFDSTIILGDEFCWGGGGDDLMGMTLIKLYADDIKTGIKPLTLFGYAAYVMSNQDDTDYEDATAWEVAFGSNYAITSNLNYSVYGAYADMDYDVDGIDDPDAVYMVANSITFNF